MSQIGRITEIAIQTEDHTKMEIAHHILTLVRDFHKTSKEAYQKIQTMQEEMASITSDLEHGHYYSCPTRLGSTVDIMRETSVVSSLLTKRNDLIEQINSLASILLGDEYEHQILAGDLSERVDLQSWDGMVTF